MPTTFEGGFRDVVMCRCRDDDGRGLHGVEKLFEPVVRPNTELLRHGRGTIGTCFVEADQPRARYVPQDANMMIPQGTGSDHPDAHVLQFWHGSDHQTAVAAIEEAQEFFDFRKSLQLLLRALSSL